MSVAEAADTEDSWKSEESPWKLCIRRVQTGVLSMKAERPLLNLTS